MNDVQPLVFVNGEARGLIDACDRGVFYGDGLFETCKLVDGVIPLWSFHEKRLTNSAQELYIPLENKAVSRLVNVALESALAQGVTSGVVKVVVTRGVGGRGYQMPAVVEPTIIVYLYPSAAGSDNLTPLTLALCDMRLGKNTKLAGHKHLNRLENVLAREQVAQMKAGEGLLRDSDDKVIECTAHNIFAFMGDVLVTPTINHSGVRGVMRELILQELACDVGMKIAESELTVLDLKRADALFICNSNRGITAVSKVLNERGKVIVNFNQDPRISALQQALIERYPAYK